ncbi:MAG: hypothetical protein M1836_003837 [Candelina mexicana]|nr:MAG: hypothetical protein M1836_003837 [Candelina mexicana]
MTSNISGRDIYPFLSQPREIRDMIYSYALVPPSGIITISAIHLFMLSTIIPPKPSTRLPTALLLSNRQISDEACAFLYGSNTLHIVGDAPSKVLIFLERIIRPSTLRMIKSIALEPSFTPSVCHMTWSPLIGMLNDGMPSLRTVEITVWDPEVDPCYNLVASINKLVHCRMLTPRAYNTIYGAPPDASIRGLPLTVSGARPVPSPPPRVQSELNKAIVAQSKVSDLLGDGWTWRYEDVDLKGDGTTLLTMNFSKKSAASVGLVD